VKVLVDEHLPPRLARALNELFGPKDEVVALRERFGTGVQDVQWIEALNQEGRWVVISADRRITRNRAEFHAFRKSRLIGFFLSKGLYKSPLARQAERIIGLWSDIAALAERVEGGAMFELPVKARIKQLKM
jgi:hypothetical protein